jgi:16S rRNA (guanine966-N2)-methyltransferase
VPAPRPRGGPARGPGVRIIAGEARGTRLTPVPAGTRPLSDRAREGLFASLGGLVPEARCADLFAGTGAVGIEALSRGAASCLFVDSGAAAIRTIRENLGKTGLSERGTVVRADLRRRPVPGGPFDLAFLDPPHAFPSGALRSLLERTGESLEPDAIVALTRPARSSTDVIPVDWLVVKRLAYGNTRILLCREGP